MTQPAPITTTARAPDATTPSVEQAIASAAQRTNIDFDFLLAQARVESEMDPNARARTSSATGLYQFIESTWLETMQRHGSRFGLGDMAEQIATTPRGTAFVADPAQRNAILALRSDPHTASLMAAGLAEDNRAALTPILGRQPDHGELYLAHFLGAGGAGRFLSAMADNPDESAAALFRHPAAANRAIFYRASGEARSLAGVMDLLDAKIENAMSGASQSTPSPTQPYITANTAAFGPSNPPTLTLRNRPVAMSTAPTAPTAQPMPSMSNVLRSTFGDRSDSDQSAAQINRAYSQLKAFGL